MEEPQAAGVEAYIGLGSNIEDRETYLRQAVLLLNTHREIAVSRCSSIYETEPVGYLDQAPFLNMVCVVRTFLSARGLLQAMQEIELRLGRVRDIRWGPRTIDLDLLLYGDLQIEEDDLQVPHPRMKERLFVLIPLAEVFERNVLPENESLTELLGKLDGKEGVARWKKTSWLNGSGPFAN
jgi:2-amino-4-hydroxy-6-hydroxymethyldihydropteridine diphosphokinase